MDIVVKRLKGLERRVECAVPDEVIVLKVDEKLREIAAGKVSLKGFRSGKVPFSVLKSRIGKSVRQDVVHQMIETVFREAVEREKLRPAGQPKLEITTSTPGSPLEFVVLLEVYPDVELGDLSKIKIEKTVADVPVAEVEKVITNMRKQLGNWETMESPAEAGDQVVIDFDGKIDGESFAGGTAQNVTIELGAGQMLPDFEQPIIGKSAGDTFDVKFKFPKDYHGKDVAGKKVIFSVTVNEVKRVTLHELNAEFIKKVGYDVGGVGMFREEIRKQLENNAEQSGTQKLRKSIMDALIKAHSLTLPKVMVAEELNRAKEEAARAPQQPAKSEKEYTQQAERHVQEALLFHAVMEQYAIQPDQRRIEQQLKEWVQYLGVHNHQPSKEQLAAQQSQIEAMVLEEQVFAKILEKVTVLEKKVAYDKLMAA